MNSFEKWGIGAAAVFAAFLLLPFPGWTADDDGPPKTRRIVLQLNGRHQFEFAGYYVAQEKGLYAARGLDVVIREAPANGDPVDAVMSGEAQFGVDDCRLLLLRSEGRPVVALAAVFQHSPRAILAAAADIDNVAGLRGKSLASRPGSADIAAYLIDSGLPLGACVMRNSFDPLTDLIEGKTDAAAVSVASAPYLLQRLRLDYRIFSPYSVGYDFYDGILYTSKATLLSDRPMVQAFTSASLEGWRMAFDNLGSACEVIQSKYPSSFSPGHLLYQAEQSRKYVLPELVDIGYMSPARWRHIADAFAKVGMLRGEPDIDGLLVSSASRGIDPAFYKWAAAAAAILIALAAAAARAHAMNRKLAAEVADRIKAEESLTEVLAAHAEREAAIKACSDIAFDCVDAERNILWTNRKSTHTICCVERPSESEHCSECLLELALSTGVPQSGERIDPDGRTFFVLATPLPGKDGRVDKVVRLSMDISERKRLEKSLHANQKKFKDLAENVSDVLWECDADLALTYISPADKAMRGYEPAEVVGRNLLDFMDPQEAEEAARQFELMKSSSDSPSGAHPRATRSIRLRQLRKDGEWIWVELIPKPIVQDGRLVGFRGASRDITARKDAEDKLQSALRDAEAMNRIMTGRELRVIELKKEINSLLTALGKESKYDSRL